MNRQSLLIIAIIAGGSILSGLAYGVSNGTIVVGDITVTGTCTGCGGEGTFTTWSTLTNSSTVTTDILSGGVDCKIDTNGNVLYADSDNTSLLFGFNGSKIIEAHTGTTGGINNIVAQSSTGKYQIIVYDTSHTLKIYKNNVLYKTIGYTSSNFSALDPVTCISSDGKYIGLLGQASNNHARVVILQGS